TAAGTRSGIVSAVVFNSGVVVRAGDQVICQTIRRFGQALAVAVTIAVATATATLARLTLTALALFLAASCTGDGGINSFLGGALAALTARFTSLAGFTLLGAFAGSGLVAATLATFTIATFPAFTTTIAAAATAFAT